MYFFFYFCKKKDMPEFESYIDVEPDEFVSSCSNREIEELIEVLIEEGYLSSNAKLKTDESKNNTYFDELWLETVSKLSKIRSRLTNEEEEIILTIANKY